MVYIQTERLLLRPFDNNDGEDIYEIYKDANVCKYIPDEAWNLIQIEDEVRKRVHRVDLSGPGGLGFACLYEGKVIGDISAWYTGIKDTVEIGYVFHPEYSGKGYASEAMRAFVEYLFEEKEVHRIIAHLDARNHLSAKLCESIGMRKEAIFLQDDWSKGVWTDSWMYGMLISDLRN